MESLYVAYRHGILVVDRPTGDPTTTARLTDHDLECVAADPRRPDRVFAGTFDGGLYRSTDGGEQFDRVGAATLPEAVMSLAVDPTDPDVLWAGTEPSRVYRSTDGGRTWRERPGLTDLPSSEEWSFPPRPDTHHVRWIEVDPADPDHLYVGIEAGALVQTRDAGATWTDRVDGSRRDNHTLAVHPDAPERVWSAAGDGYAVSRDAGRTWEHPQAGLEHRYCWSLALDPADPDTVLLSAASGAGDAHGHGDPESYVYRKRGEEPWERLDDRGLPTGEGVLRAVLARGDAPGEVYAANNHGVYRTTDAGDRWQRLDVALPDGYEDQTVRGLAVV
ncbi:MAG: WD40/YVTN/BNR-like repeat-containing protein [Halobacteriaceae archaeon]